MHNRLTALFGRYWPTAFILLGLVYVVVFVAREIGRLETVLQFSVLPLVFAIAAQCGFWLLASLLWRELVKQVSHRSFGLVESFSQLSIVNLGKYLPGKVWGMLARGSRMYLRHGMTLEQIVHSTFLEQFFLFYTAAVISMLCLGLLYFSNPWGWLVLTIAALAMVVGAPLGSLILQAMVWVGHRFIPGRSLSSGKPAHLEIRHYYSYFIKYAGIWLLISAILYGVYLTFFLSSPSFSEYLVTVVAAIAGYTAGFLAVFAPGGIGVREAVGAAVLAFIMPIDEAVLLSLIFRLWTVIAEGAAGGIAVIVMRRQVHVSR
jgi:hypothetical protein